MPNTGTKTVACVWVGAARVRRREKGVRRADSQRWRPRGSNRALAHSPGDARVVTPSDARLSKAGGQLLLTMQLVMPLSCSPGGGENAPAWKSNRSTPLARIAAVSFFTNESIMSLGW